MKIFNRTPDPAPDPVPDITAAVLDLFDEAVEATAVMHEAEALPGGDRVHDISSARARALTDALAAIDPSWTHGSAWWAERVTEAVLADEAGTPYDVPIPGSRPDTAEADTAAAEADMYAAMYGQGWNL